MTGPGPRVSVVIPCYNAQQWIRDALSCALHQTLPAEVILVDDGSTDASASIVQREFPAVRVIRTPRQGPSRARDLGTRSSSGEFIQYLDADDLIPPWKLERQVRLLDRTGADVAYGGWRRLVRSAAGKYEPEPAVERRIAATPEIELLTDFWCPIHAYLFRRSIFDAVGGWNADLPVIQDARFALDCALRGARFVYEPGVVAEYRIHRGGSVSSADPTGFVRDCLRNALQVKSWWEANGGLSSDRTRALVRVLDTVARDSRDALTFHEACAALRRLVPGYIPSRPAWLGIVSRSIGYPRAVSIYSWAARIRRALRAQ
jgi:glycosyltransferase involved in cell wall biosynthesis